MTVDWIAQLFPLLVATLIVTTLVLVIRLDRRMSRGAHSAGPRLAEPPHPIGQQQTPWELQALDDQLRFGQARTAAGGPRHEVSATVNRLLAAAGYDDPRDQLPTTADDGQLAASITRIEERLGLPPLPTTGAERGADRA